MEIFSQCNSIKRLEDVGHRLEALVNESLNNTFSWIAPKNKTHSGGSSLRTRWNVALCIQLIGFLEFFKLTFQQLGISMTAGTEAWTTWQSSERRDVRKERWGQLKHKKKRNRKLHTKLKLRTEEAVQERRDNLFCESGVVVAGEGRSKRKRKPPANGPDGCQCFCRAAKHSKKCSLCDCHKGKAGSHGQLEMDSGEQELWTKWCSTLVTG